MGDLVRGSGHRRLFEMASEQCGYFTTAQAEERGISRPLLSHHSRPHGHLIRVGHGVYRVRDYPSSPREDVIAEWLAAGREVAVVSHESALDLLDLSDVVPAAVHPRSRHRHRRPRPGQNPHDHTPSAPSTSRARRRSCTSPERSIADGLRWGLPPIRSLRRSPKAGTGARRRPRGLGPGDRANEPQAGGLRRAGIARLSRRHDLGLAFGSAPVRFGVKLQTQRSHDLQDRVEAGAAFARERLVEALAGQPGITRDLCHTLRPSDIAEGLGNECGIAVSFFKTGFEVGSHFLRGPEVLGDVVASGGRLPIAPACDRVGLANFDRGPL